MNLWPGGLRWCRFGFPFAPSSASFIDDNGKCVYKRSEESAFINNYNPYVLALAKCNRDVEVNKGYKAMSYLCKYRYLTKFDTGQSFELVDSNESTPETAYFQHFRGRYVIKRKKHMDESNPNDLVYKTHIEKYVCRPITEECERLTMPEFFTQYAPYYGNVTGSSVLRGTDRSKWKKRQRGSSIWRTPFLASTSGEAFFYQRILLNISFRQMQEVLDIEAYGTYKAHKKVTVEV
ncbi:hypothetical protein DM01DRAFT_1346533 [Hesseltinella vesiculosa]|uniref:Uncharacterized protein n=1 Tax=Hesseltinella vesiculosa TaxID=101127 RepID=A0A1X2GG23_9FUNG|nr:hypothetical protein DM01DRAFT_1346533 [Hesseltinella vesiculosa]